MAANFRESRPSEWPSSCGALPPDGELLKLALADTILASAKKKDLAMSEFVHALVPSKAFRLK